MSNEYKVIEEYKKTLSIDACAEALGLSTVKVRRILITEGLWSSKTSIQVGKLYKEGLSTEEIAARIGKSVKSVQAYLPYSKGVYHKEERSADSVYSDRYRKNIKKALEYSHIGTDGITHNEEELNTESEWNPVRLHVEIMGLINKEECNVQYGNTISRDIIVPSDIALYALSYTILRSFNLMNSHSHSFELPEEYISRVNYYDQIGILFRSPFMKDTDRYWADDYRGGSWIKWLRKKYTGPYYIMCPGESYEECRRNIEQVIALPDHHYELLEHLSLSYIFKEYKCLIFNYGNWKFNIRLISDYEDLLTQKRITSGTLKKCIDKCHNQYRPVLIAVDGYNLTEYVEGFEKYRTLLIQLKNKSSQEECYEEIVIRHQFNWL